MISYIFKNKFKNILVASFSVILILIGIGELKYAYVEDCFSLSAYILIFIYMITLKREYKLKKWLFPVAFALLTLTAFFQIRYSFDIYVFTVAGEWVRGLANFAIRALLFTGCAFCFIGTLSNFKRVKFLSLGLLICIITNFILGAFHNALTGDIGNVFFATIYYLEEMPQAISLSLFYISLFLLTLTRKSENIDITPFVEQRKLKKAEIKLKKLEQNEEEIPSDIPDGYWRCMGCGKILPDNISECECGYKR